MKTTTHMKWVLPLQDWQDRSKALASTTDEIILSTKELSRLGKLELQEAKALAGQEGEGPQRTVLLWDILMTKSQMDMAQQTLECLDLNLFSALRVQDPGAFFWAKKNCPQKDLHLILEHGNHNLKALEGWIEMGGSQLKRVVLSPQIPLQRLKNFIDLAHTLGVETELMVLGPLLLFYSPRSLLKPLYSHAFEEKNELRVRADSEESPHKNFTVIENSRGTFMFHPKDLCLLSSLSQLQDMGLGAVRLDLWGERPLCLMRKIKQASNQTEIQSLIQKDYPQECIHGFFQANKSQVLFKNLKNQKIARRNEDYLGDVVDVEKKSYLAVHLKNPQRKLYVNDILQYRTPEGKVLTTTVKELKNSAGKKCDSLGRDEIAILKPLKSISPKTAVYWISPKK